MYTEKRRTRRIFLDRPAELTVDDKNYLVREISNLSVGGCLLDIHENLPVGADCNLRILVDGTHRGMVVDAIGEIVRDDSRTTSVKFTYADPDNHAHLKNIVKFSLPVLKYNPEVRSNRLKPLP
jgi:hypothetical protein